MARARGTKQTPKKRHPIKETPLAEAIEDQRRSGASWAAVATALGLKGPGAARTAYTAATGKHHNDIEGVAVTRAPRTSGPKTSTPKRAPKVDRNPHWNEDSDQDEMIAMLEPLYEVGSKGMRELKEAARIRVKRICPNAGNYVLDEEFTIAHLKGFKFDKEERNLLTEFYDNVTGGYHCIRVQDIVEVVR